MEDRTIRNNSRSNESSYGKWRNSVMASLVPALLINRDTVFWFVVVFVFCGHFARRWFVIVTELSVDLCVTGRAGLQAHWPRKEDGRMLVFYSLVQPCTVTNRAGNLQIQNLGKGQGRGEWLGDGPKNSGNDLSRKVNVLNRISEWKIIQYNTTHNWNWGS